ncbi:HNH endonuclease [Nocardioides zeicaulis]|uniref:HNH endonuclease n=1 Tax=Nocardioides zeicaulis TaxID=1776857 RepID=A0ABV6DWS5_9ACTN
MAQLLKEAQGVGISTVRRGEFYDPYGGMRDMGYLPQELGLDPDECADFEPPEPTRVGAADLAFEEIEALMDAGTLFHVSAGGSSCYFRDDTMRLSMLEPVRVCGNHKTDVWIYQGRVFTSTDHALSSQDVLALVNESANRRRLRLAKAHAASALVEGGDSRRTRPSIPSEVKINVWQRDGGRCVECGSNESLEFDHIIPFSMGGSSTMRNLQLLCEPCNGRKGATLG